MAWLYLESSIDSTPSISSNIDRFDIFSIDQELEKINKIEEMSFVYCITKEEM